MRRRRQFRAVLAAPAEGGAEDLGDRDAQERRRDVRAVVDVLVEQPPEAAAAADQADRVDVQQQGGGAAVVGRLGVEDVGLAERQVERLRPVRVLVQQVAEVGGRAWVS